MKDIYLIGESTGLRVSDILTLKVKHLKIKSPTIKEKKTGKSKRIYIPAATRRKLLARAEARGDSDNDFIFQSPKNPQRPISRQAVWKAFERAEKKISGKKINVGSHSMRKAYANKLLRKGKSYKEIQKKMNHSDLGETLRYLINVDTGGINSE